MTISWKKFSINSSPNNFWESWDELNQLYNDAHPMLDSRFVKPLISYFPSSGSIIVLACYQASGPIAYFLIQEKNSLIANAYLPSQAQIALALLPKNIPLNNLDFSFSLNWWNIRLDFYGVDPKYHAPLTNIRQSEKQHRANNVIINLEQSFEQYWKDRPNNLRKNITRYINRIHKEKNNYLFKAITEPSDMRSAVARYGFIESKGWKGKIGTALHPSNAQGNYYKHIMSSFSKSQQAIVFELHIDKQLVASRLCILNKNQLIILKTTYDENYKKYAVGRILLYEVVKYLFTNKSVQYIDFYTNATKEQADWSTSSREMYNLSFYNGILGNILQLTSHLKIRSRKT